MHREDELRPFDAALGHGDGGDVEGGEVWGRWDVVMHGDLWRGVSSQIVRTAVTHIYSSFMCLYTSKLVTSHLHGLALADNID